MTVSTECLPLSRRKIEMLRRPDIEPQVAEPDLAGKYPDGAPS